MSVETQKYKLVLLGDTSVGKSCLAERFVKDKFMDYQEPTIGAAFLTKKFKINKEIIVFEIWDTAGQERYKSLAPMYYRGALAALVVYDITNNDSLIGAKAWIKELRKRGQTGCIIAIVGNKTDLEEKRQVSTLKARNYAIEQSCIHIETSAKTAHNVERLFEIIASRLPKKNIINAPKTLLEGSIKEDNYTYTCC
jgi:small GTP-binding protein